MSVEELAALPNLGERSATMLVRAGITDEHELRALGAVEAYIAVREAGVKTSLNLLYAIEGALTGVHWNRIGAARRESLLMEVDARMSDGR